MLFSQPSAAQTVNQSRAQSVFAELGGPGILFSANYDTRFANKEDGIGGRIGAGYVVVGGPSTFTLPIQANYLLGKAGKYFEIGLGTTYLRIDDEANKDNFLSFDDTSAILGTMTFGYRYQLVEGGFAFRASLTPFLTDMALYLTSEESVSDTVFKAWGSKYSYLKSFSS